MYNSNIQSQEKTLMEAHQRFLDYQNALYQNGLIDGQEKSADKIDALTTKNDALTAEKNALTAENKFLNEEVERLKALLSQAGISAE